MLASDALKVVCIGVGRYKQESLNLRFAAENAARLSNAFADPKGCGVPETNLRLLVDEDATTKRVIEVLAEAAAGAGNQDVLVVYFSGHGEREGADFYLLACDADPSDLSGTAVNANQVRDLLGPCRARGVLVILDCCKSAGLAEVAGGLFTTVGGQDFRLLLSASRAGQLSYEFEAFRGTIFSHHLARVVSGEVPIGDRPGIVYFSELFDFLADRLAEDLETIGARRSAQEAVFAGTYARDPRLFILQKVALETLDAEAPRYSRRFVRRAARRAAGAIAAALLVGTASYYYYLDHSHYLAPVTSNVDGHDGSYLAVFAGNPKLNALGFPHLVRVTDIPVSAFGGTAPPRLPAFSSDADIDRMIETALPVEWQAVVAGWSHDTARLIALIRKADADYDISDDPSGLPVALDLLGFRAGARGIPELEANVSGFVTGRTSAALRQLASLEPERSLDLYEDGMDGDPANTTGLLQGLGGPCPGDAPKAFADNAGSTFDKNLGRTLAAEPDPMRAIWWAALFRSGCALPARTFEAVYDHEIYRDNDRDLNVLLYARLHRNLEIIAFIQNDLAKNAAKLLRRDKKAYWLGTFDQERRVWSDLRVLNALGAGPGDVNLDDLQAYDLDKNVKLAAARMSIRLRGIKPQLVSRAKTDLWVTSALIDHGWWDGNIVNQAVQHSLQKTTPYVGTDFGDAFEYLFHMIRRHRVVQAAPVVARIASAQVDRSTIVAAARTLEALEPYRGPVTGRSPRARFFSLAATRALRRLPPSKVESPVAISDSYGWYVSHYDEGFNRFASNMYETTESSMRVMATLAMPPKTLTRFESELTDPRTKYLASAVLAAKGNATQLKAAISSPDVEVRQEAMNYAILNPILSSTLARLSPSPLAGQAKFELERQIAAKAAILDLVGKAPLSDRGLLLASLVAGAWQATPGLRIWAAAHVADFDGEVEDDAGELQLFDAH